MTILTANLERIAKINESVADSIREIASSFILEKITDEFKIESPSAENILNNLIYISHGFYNKNINKFGANSEAYSKFSSVFSEGEIDSDKFNAIYHDVHQDLHYPYFLEILNKKIASSADLTITSTPTIRKNPFYLIILGLSKLANIKELIEHVNPRAVIFVETEQVDAAKFASCIQIKDISDYLAEKKVLMGMSLGCGEATTIFSEITTFIAKNNELGIEGSLFADLSSNKSSKAAKVKTLLLQTQWHNDMITRAGYQCDEYNMLSNTAKNFASLKSKIHTPSSFPVDDCKWLDKPVVVTGSGPSLDKAICELKTIPRDSYLLVSGGSSISSLLKEGIKPDVHAQLERSEHQYKLHKELSESYDLSDILLFASSTTPGNLHEIFDRSIYFFRPALSPLALYATSQEEILSAEGPDTINSAVSFANSLQFKNIILVGVDCGSSSKASIRSKGAFGGYIPRALNRVEKGASSRSIFTNDRLRVVRDAIGFSFKLNKRSNAVNFSDGLTLNNTTYQNLSQLKSYLSTLNTTDLYSNSQIVDQIWNFSSPITQDRVFTSWSVAEPRQKCFDFFRRLETGIAQATDIRDITLLIRNAVSLDVPRSTKFHQLVPRIVRGTLVRLAPCIQQLLNSSSDPAIALESVIKPSLIEFFDLLESDLYSVIDHLDPQV